MKTVIWMCVCLPLMASAQNLLKVKVADAIKFEGNLSWEQVRQKAKMERKFIFVDCVTTWCLPCKKMEEVYANQIISDYANANFISVKVQMDTSKKDNDQVRSWYNDAAAIQSEFKVNSFPSYLFFSADGQIVHRDIGFKGVTDFLTVLKQATDSSKQYYTLLNKYKAGKLNYSDYRGLTKAAKSLKENDIAGKIARDYINHYLMKEPEEKLFTSGNITFIGAYITSKDKEAFQFFTNHRPKIDSIMKAQGVSGYSSQVLNWIISNEEIYPYLWQDNNKDKPVTASPNWKIILKRVKKKYGDALAERALVNAKILWYESKAKWDELIRYEVEKIEKYGLDTTGTMAKFKLNNMVWYHIFMHSTDSSILMKAASWMEVLVKADHLISDPLYPGWVDTYANLLYKAGRAQQALEWEKKAVEISRGDKEIKLAYEQMQQGLPTWKEK